MAPESNRTPLPNAPQGRRRLPGIALGAVIALSGFGLAASIRAQADTKSGTPAADSALPQNTAKDYTVDQLTPIINRALRGGRDYARGKKIFETIGCTMCHHFNGGIGGIGPDISGVGGRMGVNGLLREIIEPSAYISDLFGTKIVWTTDGKYYVGRLSEETADHVTLIQNYTIDPTTMTATWVGGSTVKIPNDQIDEIDDSGISPMPAGMIDSLQVDEVADLAAYLISGGNPDDHMFQPLKPTSTPAAPTDSK